MEAREEGQDDSIRSTLQNLIADCEALIGDLGEEGSRRYRRTVRTLDRQLQRARDELDDLQYAATRHARASIRRADTYVHEHPYRTSAGTAAAGVIVGAVLVFLLTRR